MFGPQSLSGRFKEEKNFSPLLGIEQRFVISQTVAYH
jgi:hypothetical protein